MPIVIEPALFAPHREVRQAEWRVAPIPAPAWRLVRALLSTMLLSFGAGNSAGQTLSEAGKLLAEEKNRDARSLYLQLRRKALEAGDLSQACSAGTAAASLHVRLGEYQNAQEMARHLIAECHGQSDEVRKAWNTLGQAQIYSGSFSDAESSFRQAAELARNAGDLESQSYAWNNLGGAQFYLGRYDEAFRSFRTAERLLEPRTGESWTLGPLRLTHANQAMLNQRLGRYLPALKLYRGMQAAHGSLRPEEEAQLLANLGALYRRLGDPPKALELYTQARRLLSRQVNNDALLSIIKNTGIVQLFDLGDLSSALNSFLEVESLARQTGSRREHMQALLYLVETHLRGGRTSPAERAFSHAERRSRELATNEERWKALDGLARVALGRGETVVAWSYLRQAAGLINGGAIIDHEAPCERRFAAVEK